MCEFNISIDTLTYDLDEDNIVIVDLLGYQDDTKSIKTIEDFSALK